MLGHVAPADQLVVADLEAGIGTLTRLADGSVDVVVVVVQPTPKSLEVGSRAAALAHERQLGRLVVVANRVVTDDDEAMIRAAFSDEEVVVVPDDPGILAADREGRAPLDIAPDAPAVQALLGLADRLAERLA